MRQFRGEKLKLAGETGDKTGWSTLLLSSRLQLAQSFYYVAWSLKQHRAEPRAGNDPGPIDDTLC